MVEGSGTYQISELGEQILHPKTDREKDIVKTKAILNVSLWNEIYSKHGKTPRENNFWAVLNDITKIEPDKAKEIGSKIYNRYLEDIEHISDDLVEVKENSDQQTETIRSSSIQDNQMSQQIESSKLNNSSDIEILSFDRFQVVLPKGDLKKEWGKLKKYMDIKLEDYKYEEIKSELEKVENIEELQDE